MRTLDLILACLAFIIIPLQPAHAVLIANVSDPLDLISAFLGPGITASNVTLTGALGATGIFTSGLASGLDIDRGIILTSGFASNAAGLTNTADDITGENGLPGHGPFQLSIRFG